MRIGWIAALRLLALPAAAAEPVRTWSLGGYDIALAPRVPERNLFEDRLVVSRGGTVALDVVENRISLNAPGAWTGGAAAPPFGENLTGGTAPQFVVETFSGGAHCCFALMVVDLGEAVRVLPMPFEGNYGARFEKGADGVWRVVGGEEIFAYWRASFAGSAAPRVVYRLEGEHLVPDEAAMRTPAPVLADLLADRAAWDWSSAREMDFLPFELLDRATALIYGGHLPEARAFFEAAWNPEVPGYAEVAHDLFSCVVRSSVHWPAIAALNRVPPEPPDCRSAQP